MCNWRKNSSLVKLKTHFLASPKCSPQGNSGGHCSPQPTLMPLTWHQCSPGTSSRLPNLNAASIWNNSPECLTAAISYLCFLWASRKLHNLIRAGIFWWLFACLLLPSFLTKDTFNSKQFADPPKIAFFNFSTYPTNTHFCLAWLVFTCIKYSNDPSFSFNRCILSTYYVSGSILGTGGFSSQ